MTVYPESIQLGEGQQAFLGLDLAHDASQVPFGAFTVMTNCYVDDTGVIRIRPGLRKLSFDGLTGDPASWDGVYVFKCCRIPGVNYDTNELSMVIMVANAGTVVNRLGYVFGAQFGALDSVTGAVITDDVALHTTTSTGDLSSSPPVDAVNAFYYVFDDGFNDGTASWFYGVHRYSARSFSLALTPGSSGTEGFVWDMGFTFPRQSQGLFHAQRVWILDHFNNRLIYSAASLFEASADFVNGLLATDTPSVIRVPLQYGGIWKMIEYRDSLCLLTDVGVLKLETDGPESEWALVPLFTDNLYTQAYVVNDLMYLLAKDGIYVSDGVSVQSISEQLNTSWSIPYFMTATKNYLMIAGEIQPIVGASSIHCFIYTFVTETWAEFDFELSVLTQQFLDVGLDPITLAATRTDNTTGEYALSLVFNNSNDAAETEDPYVYYLPLYFMDASAGGADGESPSYEDHTTDFTVTLKTGHMDFEMPEKNKEITWVEFQKEGVMGGDVTVKYYLNGSAVAAATHTVVLDQPYRKAPAPGTCRTLQVEIEFQPDDWGGTKDGSFGLQSIGFNIETVSDVAS